MPYSGTFKRPTERLEMLHSDLSGRITPASLSGRCYYFKITDGATSYKFIYILHDKSETFSHFMQFRSLVENQTSNKIKSIVNNNGGEYTSSAFKSFLAENGIRMHLTAPYTPQQNPIAEVGNRTTVEKARAMLKQAGLPNEFWAEAVSTAVYLKNRTPTASLKFKTPYELWHGSPPTYDHLRMFGCLAYMHVGKERRGGKFADTAIKGIHLGYQESHHNYRVYLLEEKRIVYSHEVVFNKNCFPLKGNYQPFTDDKDNDSHDLALVDPITPAIEEAGGHSCPSLSTIIAEIPSSEAADSIVAIGIVEGSSDDQIRPNLSI